MNVFVRPQGGFFPHINLTNINLAQFGVYTQIEPKEDNCLVQSFQSAGLPTDGIYEKVKTQYIPKKDLIDISAQLNIQIKVTNLNKDTLESQNNDYYYKGIRSRKEPVDEGQKKIDLVLAERHYFNNKKIPYTLYSIKNYHEVKNEKNWNRIYAKRPDGTYRRFTDNNKKCRFTNSLCAITHMLKNKDKYFRDLSTDEVLKLYNFKAFKKQIYNDLSYDEEIDSREIQPSKNKIVLVQQLGTNKYKFLDSDEIFNEQHLKSLIKAKKTNPDDYNLTYVVGVYYFDCEALTDGIYVRRNQQLKGKHRAYCVYTDKERHKPQKVQVTRYLSVSLRVC